MSASKAKLLLALVFIARGTSFLFSKSLMTELTPMGILAVRFLLAFLILAVIYQKKLRSCGRAELSGGIVLGTLYFVCMVLEMYGLRLIDSGVCALIENMAVVLVPIYAAVLTRTLPKSRTMMCAVLAVIGVGFLSLAQSRASGSSLGIILAILAAMTYAACIMATEKVSRDADPISIGIIQLGVMGVCSLAGALVTGTFCVPRTGEQWAMIMMLVLVCSCFGFAFQPVGQKYVPAETAAVFTVINPLTASILGIAAAGETMSLSKGCGYVMILTALILYNLWNREKDGAAADTVGTGELRTGHKKT